MHSYHTFVHSYNAFKYLMSMIVVFFGLAHPLSEAASNKSLQTYHVIFMTVLIIATSYQFYWDVYNDWGLFRVMPDWRGILSLDFSSIKPGVFLRPTLMYKKRIYFYYLAIILDLILRGMWTLSLIPQVLQLSFFFSCFFSCSSQLF